MGLGWFIGQGQAVDGYDATLFYPLLLVACAIVMAGGIVWSARVLTRLNCDRTCSSAQLRSSEARYQRLAANIPGVLYQYVLHPDGSDQFTYVSPKAELLYELTLDELQTDFRRVWQLIHPDDTERVRSLNTASAQTLDLFDATFRMVMPSGQIKWVHSTSQPEQQVNGDVIWDGIIIDISERKHRELNDQFLNQLDLNLRQLSDAQAMQSEVVTSLGEYLTVDRCILYQIDWPQGLFRSEQEWCRDVPSGAGTYPLSDFTTADLQAALASGQTAVITDVTSHPSTAAFANQYEHFQVKAFACVPCLYQGSWVAVLVVHAKTLRNWQSQEITLLQEAMTRFWPLIEQTRAVKALQDRENRYRTLFETVDQGFCICEMLLDQHRNPNDYRFLEINPAFERMTGLEKAVGKTARELVPNLESFWIETYGNVVLTGESTRLENRSDAMNRWFDVYACRIGEPQHHQFAVLFTNITDRKRSEAERAKLLGQTQAAYEQAQTANRLKDEFLMALSHELRTPLSPIQGWTKLLQRSNLTPNKTAEALVIIERNVKQQIALVDDLLDVSRIMQGKFNLTVHPVDLALVLNAAIDTVQFAARSKSITLEFEILSNANGWVMGDQNRLQQVFWNLLSNAIKFTPDGGRVDIKLSSLVGGNLLSSHAVAPTSNYVQVQIIDTGIGIPPDFLPHAFDHFRQADGSTTRKYGGLGLGLAIVRQLIELQGGTVLAESLGNGQGAVFTVRLPSLKEKDHPPRSTATRRSR
jgi:PAS domain S-box-containing protein